MGKYCWTHGKGGHDGNTCKNNTTGHINKVSFKNMQGGSYKNCDQAIWRGRTVDNKIAMKSIALTKSVPPHNYSQIAAQATTILDSGAARNFGARNTEKYCTEVHNTTTPNSV